MSHVKRTVKKSVKRKPVKKSATTKTKRSATKTKKSTKRSATKTKTKRSPKKSVRRTYRLGGPCKKETVDENWTKKSRDARLAILTEMFKDFSPVEEKCITLLQGINTHRISEWLTWQSMYLIDDDTRARCDGDARRNIAGEMIDLNNGLAKVQTRFYQRTDALLFLIKKYYTDCYTSYNSGMPGIQLNVSNRIGSRLLSSDQFYQTLGFSERLIDLGQSPYPANRKNLDKFKVGTVEEDDLPTKHVKGLGSDRVNHKNGVRIIYISNSLFEAFIENTSTPFITEIFNPRILKYGKETWDKIILFLSAYVELDDEYKEFTPDNIEQFRKELITMESYINKIHIQPKDDYYYWTIYKLSFLLPSLKNYLSDIKFRIYEKDPASRLPVIVLYVNADHNLRIHEIVREIQQHFAPFSGEIGSGDIPRYNMPINKLICLAQGNGDTKKELEKYGLLNAYFDPDQNHGVVKIGGEPLMGGGAGAQMGGGGGYYPMGGAGAQMGGGAGAQMGGGGGYYPMGGGAEASMGGASSSEPRRSTRNASAGRGDEPSELRRSTRAKK